MMATQQLIEKKEHDLVCVQQSLIKCPLLSCSHEVLATEELLLIDFIKDLKSLTRSDGCVHHEAQCNS